MARAYAAEWSRTVVQIWAGHYKRAETGPTYVAAVDIDPRTNLWRRALEAMDAGEYIAPPGHYPRANAATILIIRDEARTPDHVQEARLNVIVVDNVARVLIHTSAPRKQLEEISIAGADSIVELARQIIAAFRRMKTL